MRLCSTVVRRTKDTQPALEKTSASHLHPLAAGSKMPTVMVKTGLITTPLIRQEASMHPDLVVGGRFPDLELPDHRHERVKLSQLANNFPLIVSFYRGFW
jgi:hypothetical protein